MSEKTKGEFAVEARKERKDIANAWRPFEPCVENVRNAAPPCWDHEWVWQDNGFSAEELRIHEDYTRFLKENK